MGNVIYKTFVKCCEVKILAVGLDASGKTTLLYRLKLGKVVNTVPTTGFNVETIRHNNVNLTCWDLGLRDKARPLIKHYLIGTEGVIFVVDSNDKHSAVQSCPVIYRRKFLEKTFPAIYHLTGFALDEALSDLLGRIVCEETSRGIPVVVVANKQDMKGAMTPGNIHDVIEKSGFLQNHPWKVFGTSAMNGKGLYESLDWLTEAITAYKKGHVIEKATSLPQNQQMDIQKKTSNSNRQIKMSYYRRMVNYAKSYFVNFSFR